MVQEFGEQISACLERADQCRDAAASEADERVRQQLLDLEQKWQQVAESYQRFERLERLLVAMRYRWVRTLSATKSSHALPSAGGCGPARRDSSDLERVC